MTTQQILVGIQGGVGSFNHAAAVRHLPQFFGHKDWRPGFLHTPKAVFQGLHDRSVQFGQFALWNSTAGAYVECLHELARYQCEVATTYKLPIRHSLLHSKSSRLQDLRIVMTHRDVLKQCGKTLESRYPSFEVSVGVGELEDPSKIAEAIATGQLGPEVATVSNGLLAEHFDLAVADSEMADDPRNESTFLLVRNLELEKL